MSAKPDAAKASSTPLEYTKYRETEPLVRTTKTLAHLMETMQVDHVAVADKSSRTVAILTERLDQHRGRGQQQITVKHVTVNADQAVVTDQIVSGKTIATKLLTVGTDKPMELIEPSPKKAAPVEGGGSKPNEQ